MALEDFLAQQCTITEEAPAGQVPAQDALGGADRSDELWVTVAAGVPCLVSERVASLVDRNDARANVIAGTIYFGADLLEVVPGGIHSRHRITVGPEVYAVQGTIDPNTMGRIFQVEVERIRTDGG